MSDETEAAAPIEETPRPAKRESSARPKRTPKSEPAVEAPTAQVVADSSDSSDFTDSDSGGDSGNGWPEPEVASTGGAPGQPEHGKKKRRRRKGKGPNAQSPGGSPQGEDHPVAVESKSAEPTREPRHSNSAPPQSQPQRQRHDPDQLATKAWKIYIAEVGEEGVALIGDNDAKELARRCFRLAEIFMDEQSRHR